MSGCNKMPTHPHLFCIIFDRQRLWEKTCMHATKSASAAHCHRAFLISPPKTRRVRQCIVENGIVVKVKKWRAFIYLLNCVDIVGSSARNTPDNVFGFLTTTGLGLHSAQATSHTSHWQQRAQVFFEQISILAADAILGIYYHMGVC